MSSSTPPAAGDEKLIFAMGGGGFTMEPTNPLLDDYVLSLSLAREPRILFLPTASGDTTAQINAFYARYGGRQCVPAHVSLFRLGELDRPLEEIVLRQDIVYVSGGSMRNLLAIWKAHGLDELLTRAWQSGIVLAGLSAGAMCWFEGGITCSSGAPEAIDGLGLLKGSLTVHADGEPERLPVWLTSIREGSLPGGWAADDGVGLLFREEELERVVSSRPGAAAQRVDALAGELVRHRLEPDLLGAGETPPPALDDDVRELRRVRQLRRRMTGDTHRFADG
ncbi:MAG TPA: peptidase E [Solirubrobacteraceae bacterium]|nr:peptidase E [Solirubrobacteraceae bacterium]